VRPTRISRFEVRERLGAGAFGTVYRAYDPQLDRDVALKVPHPATLDSPTARQRFLREARAAARLRHPHIVAVFDAGADDGHDYIAAAFIDGQTLSASIAETSPDLRRAAGLVRDLAEALAYAHAQGVVHRDVKPANVLIDSAGRPHLMDFGLAYWREETHQLTQDGAVLGTPAYMAPEQAAGQQGPPLPASDQYALGVLLYQLLTGQTPFSGPAQVQLYHAVHSEPPPPRRVRPEIPQDLQTICLKALAKGPQERYADCQALADDLRRWLDGEPIHARRLGLVERVARWYRRRPAVAWLSTAAAACLAAAALIQWAAAVRLAILARQESAAAVLAEQTQQDEQAAQERAEQARQEADESTDKIMAEEARTRRELARAEEALQRAKQARSRAEENEGETRQALADARKVQQKLAETRAAIGAARDTRDQVQREIARKHKQDLLARYQALQPQIRRTFDPRWYSLHTVALSPDGSLLAGAGADGSVQLWTAAGSKGATLRGHGDSVVSVAFSPDGKRVVSADWSGVVKTWDVASGKEALSLADKGVKLGSVAFSASGDRLAAAGSDGTVRIWDADSGEEVLFLLAHTRQATAIAWSPDGKSLASAGADRKTKIWDAATGEERLALTGYDGMALALAYSPDGKRLAAACGGEVMPERESIDVQPRPVPLPGQVLVWDTTGGRSLFKLPGPGAWAGCVAFSPDGTRLAATSRERTVKVWRLGEAELLEPPVALPDSMGPVHSAVFRPDSNTLVLGSGGNDKQGRPTPAEVKVWGLPTVRKVLSLPREARVFNLDETRFLAQQPQSSAVYDLDGRVVFESRQAGVAVCACSANGELVVLKEAQRGGFAVCQGKTGKEQFFVPKPRPGGRPVGDPFFAFRSDGKRLAGVNQLGMKVWDVPSGQELFSVPATPSHVYHVSFSADGRKIYTVTLDKQTQGHVQITFADWDAATGKQSGDVSLVQTLGFIQGLHYPCAISSDGRQLVRAQGDVKVWDILDQKVRSTFPIDNAVIYHSLPALSRDGKRLVLHRTNREKLVCDLESGRALLIIEDGMSPQRWNSQGQVRQPPNGVVAWLRSNNGPATLWEVTEIPQPIPLR
jgi:WD40 repeat protein